MAAIEGAVAIKYGGNPVSLFSEQQILDCDRVGNGCSGGWPAQAMSWIASAASGLASEADYPYVGYQQSCKSSVTKDTRTMPAKVVAIANTWAAMKAALNVGPVSVTLAASSSAFQNYVGGVFSNAALCGTNVDHAITAVGYGYDAPSRKYFIKCKNSWGTR